VQLVEGSAEDGLDPRAPVLVRAADGVRLHYRTAAGDLSQGWTMGELLGPARSAVHDGKAEAWIDWAPDELELDALPDAKLRVSSSRWRNGQLFEEGEPIGWCPDLVLTESGAAHLAFDRYDAGDYDVFYRAPDGTEHRIAGTEAFEANASLAVDRDGRVFVAWDEGSADFGKGAGMHRKRELRLSVFHEGKLHALELPNGLLDGAIGRASEGFTMAELPRLVIDEAGVLWLFYRAMARWNRVNDQGKRGTPGTGANRRVAWEWRVAARSDRTEGWSSVVTLPSSDGPGVDGLAVIATKGGGVALAYETDSRYREFPRAGAWEESLSGDSRIALVELSLAGGAPKWELSDGREPERTGVSNPLAYLDPNPSIAPEGWTRMWGDLHRHSDLSRCKMDEDGNQLAQYRYAVDIGVLDFMALTEHYQHLTTGQWAYSREMSERFDRPGSFATLFGFEQAQTDGHRNFFCMDPTEALDGPFREWTPRNRFANYPKQRWIAIPHQLDDPKVLLSWPRQNAAIECEVEVYQSRRGSYFSRDDDLRAFHAVRAHPHAVDYLKSGKRFGVIAASDHVTTMGAFTAVYVREPNRANLFEGLRARRTYAATAKIALDVGLGSLIMGEEGEVAPDASLRVRVDAGAALARVEVLRNGEVAHAWHGAGDERWLSIRLGGTTQDPRLILELEDASWSSDPLAHRSTRPESILRTEAGILLNGDLGPYGECGFGARVRVGKEPILRLRRERRSEEVSLRTTDGSLVDGPIMTKVGTVRAEVRLEGVPLGTPQLDESWQPGDWKPGEWIQVRVVRMDGALAWSSPIWISAKAR